MAELRGQGMHIGGVGMSGGQGVVKGGLTGIVD